jgi:RNA polymerase sigma-70 factor, ECF subfamily
MPAHLQHALTSVITEALSDMHRRQLMPSAPQILSAEISPYLLAAEADCRPDPGTSRHNPMGIRGCRLTRTSPRATSVPRTPSGSLPPQWCTPLNPAWPAGRAWPENELEVLPLHADCQESRSVRSRIVTSLLEADCIRVEVERLVLTAHEQRHVHDLLEHRRSSVHWYRRIVARKGDMDESDWLAERFQSYRSHLHAVAYRMLGSMNEADDALQDAWLRLSRVDTRGIENLRAWLTTVVARVCLDMPRARKSRREEPLERQAVEGIVDREDGIDPERDAMLADSVGLALLVVLDTLTPAQRLAFVLHDTFGMLFDEIAAIVGCSTAAAKKLASRGRHRVHGTAALLSRDLATQRRVVEAFLVAVRRGDIAALLAVLDPGVVRRADGAKLPQGMVREVRGAQLKVTRCPAGGAGTYAT